MCGFLQVVKFYDATLKWTQITIKATPMHQIFKHNPQNSTKNRHHK